MLTVFFDIRDVYHDSRARQSAGAGDYARPIQLDCFIRYSLITWLLRSAEGGAS